jgi:hypothetical protein
MPATEAPDVPAARDRHHRLTIARSRHLPRLSLRA